MIDRRTNDLPEVHQSILDAVTCEDGLEAQETIIRIHNRTLNLLLKG